MVSVEHFKRSDVEQFTRIVRTLSTGQYYEQCGTLQYRLSETLDQANGLPPSRHWDFKAYDLMVAYVDGAIAGYCVYIPSEPGVELYVVPRYRRQGVATELVKAVRKLTGFKVLHAKSGFPGSEYFFKRNHIYVENSPVVYGTMRELNGGGYEHLPAEDFVKLYKKAIRTHKLRLHHRLRKENGTKVS